MHNGKDCNGLPLWDELRGEIEKGNTSWGKNQILQLMDRLEKEELRRVEYENQFEKDKE